MTSPPAKKFCPNCGTQLQVGVNFCPSCATPINTQQQFGNSPVAPAPPSSKKVGVLLGIGILFIPYIFSWFTLRTGHTTLARTVSLGWLGFVCLIFVMGNRVPSNRVPSENNSATDAQQKKCTKTLAEAPELRGFKLGMTLDQIRKRIPNFKINKPDEFGFAKGTIYSSEAKSSLDNPQGTYVNPSKYPEFKEIFMADLGLINERVVRIKIGYPSGELKMENEEFQKSVAESLKLPVSAYVTEEGMFSVGNAMMNCEGFNVEVGKSFWKLPDVLLPSPYFSIEMRDSVAFENRTQQREQKVDAEEEAERQKEEQKRREFKP